MAPPELVASTVEAKLRSLFNRAFTNDQYDSFLRCMNESTRWPAGFRLAETPVFLTPEFAQEVVRAARDIVAQTRTSAFAEHAASAIPPGLEVPRESLVDNWLRHVQDVGVKYEDELRGMSDPDARAARLCELNVMEQVINVARTDTVLNAWARGQSVIVHGWIYDVNDGLLHDLQVTLEEQLPEWLPRS